MTARAVTDTTGDTDTDRRAPACNLALFLISYFMEVAEATGIPQAEVEVVDLSAEITKDIEAGKKPKKERPEKHGRCCSCGSLRRRLQELQTSFRAQ